MSYFEGKNELVEAALAAIQRVRPDIVALSSEIFEDPEPAFAEQRAASRLTDFLASSGFEVETGVAGLPTAFTARYQRFDSEAMRKGLRHGNVAILAEYDADSDGGHTAGRHLVAGAALGSAVGLAAALQGVFGRVTVIGCPAASSQEGKQVLAAAGLFEGEDSALGSRPMSTGSGFQPTINGAGETVADALMQVQFSGPGGESDARQRFATEAEGLAQQSAGTVDVEVALSERAVEVHLRSSTNTAINDAIQSLRNIAETSASNTGATVDIEISRHVPALNVNRLLARRIKTFGDNHGLKQNPIVKSGPSEASDWAHVSLITPTVQAMFPVAEDDVESGTQAFAEASITPFAYDQMLAAAGAVALTGLDLMGDMEFRGFAEGELIRTLKAQGVKRTPRRWLGVHPVKPRDDANGHAPATASRTARKGTA